VSSFVLEQKYLVEDSLPCLMTYCFYHVTGTLHAVGLDIDPLLLCYIIMSIYLCFLHFLKLAIRRGKLVSFLILSDHLFWWSTSWSWWGMS